MVGSGFVDNGNSKGLQGYITVFWSDLSTGLPLSIRCPEWKEDSLRAEVEVGQEG